MNITVTVGVGLSVDITGDPYDFGPMATSDTSVSSRAITVTNDSGGRTEDYQIKGANTAAWTLSDTVSPDNFVLYALMNSVRPVGGDFGASDDLTTSDQNMGNGAFTGDTDGDDVANAATRNLWFRLDTPSSTSSQAEQTITVTITAADAATF
jgi:hypothetical protein